MPWRNSIETNPAEPSRKPEDLAGPGYWQRLWEGRDLPDPIDPLDWSLANYVNIIIHEEFDRILRGRGMRNMIEIGCAGSAWLPYFHKEFGYEVTGMDYDEHGCDQAREVCEKAGVRGTIVRADIFAPPPHLIETFDVAMSFGLVEHFSDTTAAIQAIAAMVRPGGLVLTWIPNMTGMIGALQRALNRPVYMQHVPLNAATLAEHHVDAGLNLMTCVNRVFLNFGICNVSGLPVRALPTRIKRQVFRLLSRLSKTIWALEKLADHRIRPNTYTGSYIFCAARKP